ncbi:MAG: cupin domain-containing protein [Kiritimatiellia bacterium]
MKTTEQLPVEHHVHNETPCHGGEGPWKFMDYLAKLDPETKKASLIKYIHDDILPPGSAFGVHSHPQTDKVEEWYVCLEGEGTMVLDGVETPFCAGQANVCRGGGSHGIRNTGKKNMRFLVILASA